MFLFFGNVGMFLGVKVSFRRCLEGVFGFERLLSGCLECFWYV